MQKHADSEQGLREMGPMESSEQLDDFSTRSSIHDAKLAPPPNKRSQKDEKLVKAARAVVMLVLLVSASLVATFTYLSKSKSEYNAFEAQVRTPSTFMLVLLFLRYSLPTHAMSLLSPLYTLATL
jgi:hypothetical protein